ncbi:MAG: carotenoid biosynthesis protein [Flavobacteriales bacterium]|nr:carotenoid biosynthesis protein [Flavobacteriales bacterium]
MKLSWQAYRLPISIFMLLLFYAVGFWGFSGTDPMKFARLTWLHLLVTCFFVFFPVKNITRGEWMAMAGIAVLGYVVEVVGVLTAALFGDYHYGANLGYKMYDVPLVISINWLVMVYVSYSAAALFFSHPLLIALLGAGIMTGMDFFIEPVAVKLDYWQWKDGIIPLQNYIAWFSFGFVFHLVMAKTFRPQNNPAAWLLLIMQLIFFIYLNRIL